MERSLVYAVARVGCSSLSLKPEQKECIKYIFDGKDVFVWLPTGFGKSLCYEVLPFIFDRSLAETTAFSLWYRHSFRLWLIKFVV